MAATTKRKLSPEAKAASKARMAQFWDDVRSGKRESPQAAKARKQVEVKTNDVVVKPTPELRAAADRPMVPAAITTTGPRSIESSPPLISLFKSGSVYVLRISDIKYNPIAAAIGREIKDGTGIVVVTPTDTKMFELKQARPSNARPTVATGNPQAGSVVEAEDESNIEDNKSGTDPQQEAARLAQEAEAQAQEAGVESLEQLEEELATAETPAQRRNALKAIRKTEDAGNNSTCGRCRGVGQIMVALESGGAVPQACPVCRGQGSIRRFGMR